MSAEHRSPDPRRIPSGAILRGVVRVPGSKSIAQRALLLAALADGPSRILGAPRNDDVEGLVTALRGLGITLETTGDEIGVVGTAGVLSPGDRSVDAGENGTALRALLALAALRPDRTIVDGAGHRPVGPLLLALRSLGARIEGERPPFTIHGPLGGGVVSVPSAVSSQFATALLLVAPLLPDGLSLETPDLVSAPYIDLTIALLDQFGATVTRRGATIEVQPGGLRGCALRVEPDASSAAFFLAAAAVTGGEVTIEGLGSGSLQGDVRFAEILAGMGCAVGVRDATIRVGGGSLRGIDVDLRDTPDLVPPLAAVAAHAEGPTRITGVAHLRHKESDRLATLERGLGALGATVRVDGDRLLIEGPLSAASEGEVVVDPAGDHRMAMAFAVVGLDRPGVWIADPGCVEKSDPEFFDRLESLVEETDGGKTR